MTPALANAMASIQRIADEEAAFATRLACDSRYQYLLRTARANDVDLHEDDYGWGGFDRIANYHQTSKPMRRQRAKRLLQVRRAYLFNGYRGMAKATDELTRYRREEKHRDGVELCGRNLAAVDRILANRERAV